MNRNFASCSRHSNIQFWLPFVYIGFRNWIQKHRWEGGFYFQRLLHPISNVYSCWTGSYSVFFYTPWTAQSPTRNTKQSSGFSKKKKKKTRNIDDDRRRLLQLVIVQQVIVTKKTNKWKKGANCKRNCPNEWAKRADLMPCLDVSVDRLPLDGSFVVRRTK